MVLSLDLDLDLKRASFMALELEIRSYSCNAINKQICCSCILIYIAFVSGNPP